MPLLFHSIRRLKRLLATVLLGLALPACALSAPSAPSTTPPVAHKLPLARFSPSQDAHVLMGQTATLTLELALPALEQVRQARLVLKGANSIGLDTDTSIALRVNGTLVQQNLIQPGEPAFELTAAIAPELLHHGANTVNIQVHHQHQEDCQDPEQIWTELDLDGSRLELHTQPLAPPPTLALLPQLLDPNTLAGTAHIPVLQPPARDGARLDALGTLAQALGRRFGRTPVRLHTSPLPASLQDAVRLITGEGRLGVLIGSHAELQPLLRGQAVPDGAEPYVALLAPPSHPQRYILVLAGQDSAAVLTAARTLLFEALPIDGQPWMQVHRVDLPRPDAVQHYGDLPYREDVAFALKSLDFTTRTFQGQGRHRSSLRVWNNGWQSRLQLHLHLTYSAGMSRQSMLNVYANGQLTGSVPLQNPEGSQYLAYAVTIPANTLTPGWNSIEFEASLQPLQARQYCAQDHADALALTLHDDSTLQKLHGTAALQPDLAMLAGAGSHLFRTGTPLIDELVLADTDTPTLSAGLNLLAKLAQTNPYRGWKLLTAQDAGASHQLWVGARERLPAHLLPPDNRFADPQAQLDVPLRTTREITPYERIQPLAYLQALLPASADRAPQVGLASLQLHGAQDSNTLAWTARTQEHYYTVFTAVSSELLDQGIQALTTPALWPQLRGSYALWNAQSDRLFAVDLEQAPFNSYGLRAGLGIWISQSPWLSLLIVLAMLLALTGLIRWTLNTTRK